MREPNRPLPRGRKRLRTAQAVVCVLLFLALLLLGVSLGGAVADGFRMFGWPAALGAAGLVVETAAVVVLAQFRARWRRRRAERAEA